jgi:hypothetical protein
LERWIQTQGIGKADGKLFELAPSFREWTIEQIVSVEMQHVEDEINDWQLGQARILQLLEVRSAGCVERNHFSVEYRFPELQPFQGFGDVRILGGVVQARHGVQQGRAAIDYGNDAIAVLLGFIEPLIAFRQPGDALTLHGLDESRTRLGIACDTLHHVIFVRLIAPMPNS